MVSSMNSRSPTNDRPSSTVRPLSFPQLPATQSRPTSHLWRLGRKSTHYGDTNISGDARVVVGDAYHHHVHTGNTIILQSDSEKQITPSQSLAISTANAVILADLISDYDPWKRQKQLLDERIPETCEWIWRQSEYKRWSDREGPSLLICTGSVGCGKSITASFVCEELKTHEVVKNNCLAAYFLDDDNSRVLNLDSLLRALLKQLLSACAARERVLPQPLVKTIRDVFIKSKVPASSSVLAQVFGELRKSLPHYVVLIDGLDLLAEHEILEFLRFLQLLFKEEIDGRYSARWIVFCRDTLGRGIQLESTTHSQSFHITLPHIERDLHRYIDHQVDQRWKESTTITNEETISRIKTVLRENCEKMFIWVRLQIGTLWNPRFVLNDEDVDRQLESLPQGLDDIYLRCLKVIDDTNDGRSQDIAPRVFKWVANSRQPLNMLQARELVSITADQLPLRSSQVLSASVTDFCANLVECDRSTGLIRFPHRSVKEFLSKPSQLPPELLKYALSYDADDLWCGQICHAYAEIYHARGAVVKHRTFDVDRQYATDSINTALRRSLPFRWPCSPTKSNGRSQLLSFPVPTGSRQRELIGENFNSHEYICRAWLSHNRLLKPEHSWHSSLAAICLSHDEALLPWSKDCAESPTSIDRYRRMAEFAVTSDNPCLLRIVVAHLGGSRDKTWGRILNEPFSGTDSSLLHVAIALDHTEVLRMISPAFKSSTADSTGRSALALAIELRRAEAVSLLLSSYPTFPTAVLECFDTAHSKTVENIFMVCVDNDNEEAAKYVLNRIADATVRRHLLSDALYRAVSAFDDKKGAMLVSWGADPNFLNLQTHSNIQESLDWKKIKQAPAAVVAMQRNDVNLWKALIRLGASTSYDGPISAISLRGIVECFKSRIGDAKIWIILFPHCLDFHWSAPSEEYFVMFYELTCPSQAKSRQLREPMDRKAISYYQRLLLTKFALSASIGATWTLPLPHAAGADFASWFLGVADDVLLKVLQLRLINMEHLCPDGSLGLVMQRGNASIIKEALTIVCETAGFPEHMLPRCFGGSLMARVAEGVQVTENGTIRYSEALGVAVCNVENALSEVFFKPGRIETTITSLSNTFKSGWKLVDARKTHLDLLTAFASLCQYPLESRLLWVGRLIQNGIQAKDLLDYARDWPTSRQKLLEQAEDSTSMSPPFEHDRSAIFFLELLNAEISSVAAGRRRRLPVLSRPVRSSILSYRPPGS